MKNLLKTKHTLRLRRHRRVRGKIAGTSKKPRLAVFRSSKYIWAQLIDDEKGHTIAAASSRALRSKTKKTKTEEALLVGQSLAKKAKEHDIQEVVFDRGGHAYHGRVAALAQGARDGGLKF